MKKLFIAILVLFMMTSQTTMATPKTEKDHSQEHVVLLHEILLSNLWMKKLEKLLQKADYQTLNINYRSKKANIETLLGEIHPQIQKIQATNSKAIHFIGHSMGNLLIRTYINQYHPSPKGKVGVASTRLPEQQDHIVIHATHTFIMFNQHAIKQSLHFLAYGNFQH